MNTDRVSLLNAFTKMVINNCIDKSDRTTEYYIGLAIYHDILSEIGMDVGILSEIEEEVISHTWSVSTESGRKSIYYKDGVKYDTSRIAGINS